MPMSSKALKGLKVVDNFLIFFENEVGEVAP